MGVIHLSDADFDREVLHSEKLVLVDFWALWCAPCQMIAPILEELSHQYNDKLKICKISIDENRLVAAKYQILSIPTLLFFKNGKIINQLVGGKTAADIKKVIDSLC